MSKKQLCIDARAWQGWNQLLHQRLALTLLVHAPEQRALYESDDKLTASRRRTTWWATSR